MLKNKIKFTFFLLGVVSIFLAGISWWITKTFGEVHILQVLWHIEKAHSLTGYDEDVLRHFMQFIGFCVLISIIWFLLLYKRQSIYIYLK